MTHQAQPTPSRPARAATLLLDQEGRKLLDAAIANALATLEGPAPLLATMVRFHLGLIDSTGEPTNEDEQLALQGKRLRPAVAMLAAQTVNGSIAAAAPLAAAVELLHNFTLIHDDIQDRSPNRRHRATVWRVWGDAQAINAGDALFAVSHLTLLETTAVPPATLIDLTRALNHTTIAIVRGQVLDLGFEGRNDVTPEQYLEMISGKTAAIVRFAAQGGAIVGGASSEIADRFAEFGEALGIGFQIQDDLLGIWGDDAATGKTRGDDIRRRKQSLPVLLLRSKANTDDTERLDALYAKDEIEGDDLQEVLDLLDRYEILPDMEAQIASAHERARQALDAIAHQGSSPASIELASLVERLGRRQS